MSDVIKWSDMLDIFGCNPAVKMTGWIPPDQRTQEQQSEHESVLASMVPRFNAVNPMTAPVPETCIALDMLVKTTNTIGLWPWQIEGSCVGVGGAMADQFTMAGDVLNKGDAEEIILPFPFATWGVGRQLGGLRGRGDGSFGGAQIKAESEFGYIAHNDQAVPQGTVVDGHWIKWSSRIELDYSWPPQFPVAMEKLKQIANPQRLTGWAQLKTLEELEQAFAQGYGVTQASNWGCENPRVVDGRLTGKRNARWPHQTWQGGPDRSTGKRWWLWGNQWGKSAHGVCPWMANRYGSFGFKGGIMWIDDQDMQSILSEDEVFARSGTGGFPLRNRIDWSKVQW